jgi:catechol 2,3-dioxygenase-like lactoylglutathione lyase family enzyme
MIQATGVDHVVLHVSDVQRSKNFYTEILGMTPYREDEGQVFLHAGRQGVALFKKVGGTRLTAGNDLNHLALNVAAGRMIRSGLNWRNTASPLQAVRARTAASTSATRTDIAYS